MTFEQVVLLLTLLGGAVYITFEITWTISNGNPTVKRNDRSCPQKASGHSLRLISRTRS